MSQFFALGGKSMAKASTQIIEILIASVADSKI